MCKGTVAFLSDPPLKGKTHTHTHSDLYKLSLQEHTNPLSLPSFALFSLFLNNSRARRSPEVSEGPKLNRPNLASNPGAATRPLGGRLQCIPGESIVKDKHFLWRRASPTTITFYTFICWLESQTNNMRAHTNPRAHTHTCTRKDVCVLACMMYNSIAKHCFDSYLCSHITPSTPLSPSVPIDVPFLILFLFFLSS